jgi:hypothetical protein
MAGSLIKIDEEIVTSAVAGVYLGGANWDSSYDVYMVKIFNMQLDTDTKSLEYRFTIDVSGTQEPAVTLSYDYGQKVLRSNTTFQNNSGQNQDYLFINSWTGTGTGTGETTQAILYLFNFNNSSEYSFVTKNQVTLDFNARLIGGQGGAVYTIAQAHNGLYFSPNSGNISTGTFSLYGIAN